MYRSLIMFFVLLMVAAGLPAVAYGQDDEETKQKRQAVWEERIPAPLEGAIDPDTYVLGPWDILVLSLKGGETKTHELTVLPEGNVILPNAGTVRAAGLTLTDFRAEVRRVLKRYYRNMDIDCQLARPRTFVTYVVGEVNDPQQVTITAPFRLSQALGQVGGVTERGSLRRIQIRGEDGTLQRTVDMFLFLKRGDFEHNPVLSEGQSVYVPARSEEVQVVGEVLLPGLYELVEGETAADMIKHAGGLGPLADPEHIVIEGGARGPHHGVRHPDGGSVSAQ